MDACWTPLLAVARSLGQVLRRPALRELVARRVAARVDELHEEHRRERRGPALGRDGVLLQRPTDTPGPSAPGFDLKPRVACRDRWRRAERLQGLGHLRALIGPHARTHSHAACHAEGSGARLVTRLHAGLMSELIPDQSPHRSRGRLYFDNGEDVRPGREVALGSVMHGPDELFTEALNCK